MFKSERGDLRVDIPVGFLLTEAREILVSVDRPADSPLAIRLRLVPAEARVPGPRLHAPPTPTPRRVLRPTGTDGYVECEYGGSD